MAITILFFFMYSGYFLSTWHKLESLGEEGISVEELPPSD